MSTAADTLEESMGPQPSPPPIPEPSAHGNAAVAAAYVLRDREALFERIRQERDLTGLILQGVLTGVAGSAIFGIALGIYAQTFSQIAASALKLPILLLGTVILCFPVFHLLQSGQAERPLRLEASLALQATALGAVAVVWGCLSPAVMFLVSSTQHYRLCQFLAVGVGAAGGIVGLQVLLAGYSNLCQGRESADVRLLTRERSLLAYFLLFSCVGGQLAWVLRPFIGSPTMPFQIFRAPDPEMGNFFVMLLRMLGLL